MIEVRSVHGRERTHAAAVGDGAKEEAKALSAVATLQDVDEGAGGDGDGGGVEGG